MNAKESPSASTSFSVSFMLQCPFLFFSFLPWSAAPFSSSLFFFGQRVVSPFFFPALTFLFLLMCCPFSAQVLSPKCFSVQPNTFLFSFFFSVFSSPFLFQFNTSFCCFCSACLSLVFSASLLLFYRHVALLSSAFYFFSPKPFLAQNTFSVQPKNIIFSPKHFCFSPRSFFSSAQKSLPVCGSAPPSFCFFSSCLSFLPLATMYCPFSAQVFNSKPFSAASHLFI